MQTAACHSAKLTSLLLPRQQAAVSHRLCHCVNPGRRPVTNVCRIGCSSGFWGDTSVSTQQLVKHGNIDYLVSDYLSEITMSLLAGVKMKSPKLGFAPDFINYGVGPMLKEISKQGIRVVTNAGGINPLSCAEFLISYGKNVGLDLSGSVAVVTGDDAKNLMPGESSGKLINANAYLGAQPIAQALNAGAQFVITGRCVDSALVLGPLIHEFRWSPHDLDLLAAGSLAGHIVECGAQCTGGIFTDYESVPDWHSIGFPVAECHRDGRVFITKPPGTGGLVTTETVGEQIVYEIGDPAAYLLPDCTLDLRRVRLEQAGENRVAVLGARGRPPPMQLKVSGCEMDGYRLTAVSVVAGGLAAKKARLTAEAVLKRVRQIFQHLDYADFTDVTVQVIGAEDAFGASGKSGSQSAPREAALWLAAKHQSKEALEVLSREIAPAGTGMAPGLTALVGGRPKVSPVLRLVTRQVDRSAFKPQVHFVGGRTISTIDAWCDVPASEFDRGTVDESDDIDELPDAVESELSSIKLPCRLIDLAVARSGDKGDACNIGVLARRPEFYPLLRRRLTSDAVADFFKHVFPPDRDHRQLVHRYELPGLRALNFVLDQSLGGGGVASLRYDPQGKAFAQMLLDLELGPEQAGTDSAATG
ncbi:hypothetical protein BOX15_Mlig019558g2 [Macrostomum lignano]|uniref:DUF1446 domain-containing protein n=1 Tax=Macrostomum lignano TaxID=282301 RepID=A0A267GG36_9PLAT|nr:hypothetical protein BOX15_Mlig019558g2 [Macrostomum lignano]